MAFIFISYAHQILIFIYVSDKEIQEVCKYGNINVDPRVMKAFVQLLIWVITMTAAISTPVLVCIKNLKRSLKLRHSIFT